MQIKNNLFAFFFCFNIHKLKINKVFFKMLADYLESEQYYFLYRHIRRDKNEVFYVGVGAIYMHYTSFKQQYRRAFDKKGRGRGRLWVIIAKKCKYNYDIEIIWEATTREEIFKKEREFVKLSQQA